MIAKMMKSLGVGVALAALMVSGPVFAANPQSGTLVLNGTVPLDAHLTITGTGTGAVTEVDGVGGPAVSGFTLAIQGAGLQTFAALFSITWTANGSGANIVELSSANAGNLVNGATNLAYALTCATCAAGVPASTALTALPVTWDTNTGLTNLTRSFDLEVTAATNTIPAGVYTDTVTVTVTAV